MTIRQCAVLVGGLGTRLGALTATTPKPLLRIGDRPFLAWLLREFVRFGIEEFVLLAGHGAAAIEACLDALIASLPRKARVVVSQEPSRSGTGGAVWHARDRLDERFLLCNGDSLFATNLARLFACETPSVMLRPMENGARYGSVELQGDTITGFRERPASGGASLINTGIYLFDRGIFDELRPDCSLEADVLPRLASRSALRGCVGEGYFRDIGVPEDLALAQKEIPRLLQRSVLFLDRDGVINIDHGYVASRDRFEWTPGALEAIRTATDAGWHVFVVTNQSGVARGHYDEAAVQALHEWMCNEVRRHGGTIDDIRYCPYHEDASVPAYRKASDWRKPRPGMLLDLMQAWELDTARCVLVGDQATDTEAARAAGIEGRLFAGGNLAEFVQPILETAT